MKIHRSNPASDFTILPNAALRDQRLSYTARGILAELLTHCDGWETNADALWKLAQKNRDSKSGEGRRAIRAAFAELEEHGYLVRRRVQDERGRFVTELHLFDTPHRGTETGTSENAHRRTGFQTSVGATSETGTSKRRTNEEELSKESSSTLADARVGDAHASPRDPEADFDRIYDAVQRLDENQLRNALLAFERRRPRIYRECRQTAIDHIMEREPKAMKWADAGRNVDIISYGYALRHYQPDYPAWLLEPLQEDLK